MAKRGPKKRPGRQVRLVSAIARDGEKVMFKPAKGSRIIVEYPPTWPSEFKRLQGVVRLINETNGNVYAFCALTDQCFGVNYLTAEKHDVKILIEEFVDE